MARNLSEDLASKYLRKNKLKIIAQNYLCRQGELDIVALDKSTLVFVEVRQRSCSKLGTAGESITPAKQKKNSFSSTTFHSKQSRMVPSQLSL